MLHITHYYILGLFVVVLRPSNIQVHIIIRAGYTLGLHNTYCMLRIACVKVGSSKPSRVKLMTYQVSSPCGLALGTIRIEQGLLSTVSG